MSRVQPTVTETRLVAARLVATTSTRITPPDPKTGWTQQRGLGSSALARRDLTSDAERESDKASIMSEGGKWTSTTRTSPR